VQWWTIEVLDAPGEPGTTWQAAYSDRLVEVALMHGVLEWTWVVRPWGVIVQLAFPDESDWLRFRATPSVAAALDAVPDPVSGLLVYPGLGGGSGAGVRRGPRPSPLRDGAAAPLPNPVPESAEPWLGPREAGQLG